MTQDVTADIEAALTAFDDAIHTFDPEVPPRQRRLRAMAKALEAVSACLSVERVAHLEQQLAKAKEFLGMAVDFDGGDVFGVRHNEVLDLLDG